MTQSLKDTRNKNKNKNVTRTRIRTKQRHKQERNKTQTRKQITEQRQNIGRGTSQKIGDTSQKVIEESKLRIEDEGVKGMREEVGKTVYEAVKTSEKENNVGEGMPHNIGDTSHDKEFEVQEMEDNGGFEEEEKLVSEKMLDDANGNKIGEVIQKQIEESKIEYIVCASVYAHVPVTSCSSL